MGREENDIFHYSGAPPSSHTTSRSRKSYQPSLPPGQMQGGKQGEGGQAVRIVSSL